MKITIWISLFIFVSGCSGLETRQSFDSQPNPSKAYLTGSFINSYRESFARLAIEINGMDIKHSLRIELEQLDNYNGLDIYEIDPGTYTINKLVRLAAAGGKIAETDIEEPNISKPFVIEAGNIYYLGHFDGVSGRESLSAGAGGGLFWMSQKLTQGISVSLYTLDDISNEIYKKYPSFENIPIKSIFRLNNTLQPTELAPLLWTPGRAVRGYQLSGS